MPINPLTESRRERIVAALTGIAGAPVRVLSEEHIGHAAAAVTRLILDRKLPRIGSSVVVKTRRTDGDGHGGPPFLRREIAGLQTAAVSGVVAELLIADDRSGLVVQTDVGSWPTVQDLLLGNDPDAATAGVIEMASAAGRLHATTAGCADDHRRRLDGFGADHTSGLVYEYTTAHWERIEAACDDLRLPSARPVREQVAALLRRIAAPGPYAGLTHRDLNPTNVLITDRGARLVDFEGCCYGHIGIDACFLIYPFPHHSNPWGLLPDTVIRSAVGAYRRALADGSPGQLPAGFDQMLADGAAIPLIGRVSRLPLIAGADQSSHDSWRRRGQIVQQVRTFTGLARRADHLAEVARWCEALAAAMLDRWPDANDPPPPLYPAYQRRPTASVRADAGGVRVPWPDGTGRDLGAPDNTVGPAGGAVRCDPPGDRRDT